MSCGNASPGSNAGQNQAPQDPQSRWRLVLILILLVLATRPVPMAPAPYSSDLPQSPEREEGDAPEKAAEGPPSPPAPEQPKAPPWEEDAIGGPFAPDLPAASEAGIGEGPEQEESSQVPPFSPDQWDGALWEEPVPPEPSPADGPFPLFGQERGPLSPEPGGMAPGEKEEAGPEPSAGEKSEFEPLLSPLQEGMEPVFLPSQEEAGDFGPGSLAPPPSQEGEAEAIAEPEAESPFLPGFEEDERQEEAPGPEMQTEEGGSPPSSPPVSPEAESPFLSEGGESPYLAPKEGSALPPAPIQPPSPLPLAADVFTLGAGDGSLYFTNGASQVRTLEMYGLTTAKSIAVLKGWLFIANGVRNAVKAVPISDRAKEVDISVGKNAFDVLASVSAGTILALSSSSNEMDVIDAKKKVSEMAIKLPGTPLGGAVSQKDGNAYITFSTKKGGGVAMYRSNGAADVVYRFPPEFAASQANSALDEEKGILYVPIAEQPAILRIDIFSKRILGLFSLPGKPASIAFNPKNGRLYIADSASGQILVADANTGVITTAAPLEKKPAFGQIALDAENSRLYVPAKNSGKVFVVDTQENEAVDSWHQPEAFYAAVRPGA